MDNRLEFCCLIIGAARAKHHAVAVEKAGHLLLPFGIELLGL